MTPVKGLQQRGSPDLPRATHQMTNTPFVPDAVLDQSQVVDNSAADRARMAQTHIWLPDGKIKGRGRWVQKHTRPQATLKQ